MAENKIVVVGVGGAGGNMVNNMIASGEFSYHTIIANTDLKALEHSMAKERLM